MRFERWSNLSRLFGARPLRERIVLVFAVMLGVGFIWNDYFQASLIRQAASDPQRVAQLTRENAELESRHAELVIQAEADPNSLLRRSIKRLMDQNQRIEEDINAMSGRLVNPSRMVEALSKVLVERADVQLIGMSNLPSELLYLKAGVAGGAATQDLQIYKHGLRFEVKGRYLSILKYLIDLEDAGTGFYWEAADFSVAEYPFGRLSVEVFTLSTEEQLLDV